VLDTPHPWRPLTDEQHAAGVTASCASTATSRDLLDYSERDTLTGLLNRKTFDGSFLRVSSVHGDRGPCARCRQRRDTERRSATPANRPGSESIDIDHFKRRQRQRMAT
jgi:hypothetical protein